MSRHFVSFAAALLLSGIAPAKAELQVSISKSQQRIAVTVDGTEFYRWPVSTGRRGHDTPAGKFRPTRLERHWYSRQYSLTPMPWSMFFHRGYAMHGTTEVYNLGHVASHGCVRLRPDNAAILYSLVRRHGFKNTTVTVMNGPLPALPDALPMADAGKPPAGDEAAESFAKSFAKAHDDEHDEIAAKAQPRTISVSGDEKSDGRGHVAKSGAKSGALRVAAEAYRVSAGSDESQILRERQAWLRSLDRKYGFTR